MEHNTRFQIFKSYSLLIIAVAVLVMLLLTIIVMRGNYDKTVYEQQISLDGVIDRLCNVLDQYGLITSQVASNSDLLSIFVRLNDMEDPKNYFEDNLLDSVRTSSMLETINSLISSVSRICVFNLKGDIVTAGKMCTEADVIRESMDAGIPDSIAKLMPENHKLITSPHPDWWSSSETRVISYIIPMLSLYNEKCYGFIEIEFLPKVFEQMIPSDESNAYYLSDQNYQDVLSNQPIMTPLVSFLADVDPNQGTNHARILLNNQQNEVFVRTLRDANWQLMKIVSVSEIMRSYSGSYFAIFLSFIGLIVLLLFISYRMAGHLSAPLSEFANAINNVTLENMNTIPFDTSIARSKEMMILEKSFRRMLLKLDSSMKLEMKAYLNALQSQMNPHFLYNMLTVITEIADSDSGEEERKHMVAICQNLAYMLRYMSKYESDFVPLESEVQHLSIYLQLMKDRYEENFNFDIHAVPSMMDILVPKMILQPLAENCFQHGFKAVHPPWFVSVDMEQSGGYWFVTVTDNGGGITSDEIRSIHEKVEAFSVNMASNYEQINIGGLGLVNTLLRLKLFQNNDPIFRIDQLSQGTKVTIGGKNDLHVRS